MKRVSGGGYWNRVYQSREKLTPFNTGTPKESSEHVPNLSIQCFERRHGDCDGGPHMAGPICECACHGTKPDAEKGGE